MTSENAFTLPTRRSDLFVLVWSCVDDDDAVRARIVRYIFRDGFDVNLDASDNLYLYKIADLEFMNEM